MRRICLCTAVLCLGVVTSCQKEDPIYLTLSNQSAIMYHSDKLNAGASTNSANPITYKTSDKYVAEVDEAGNIEAGVIGKADITVSNGEISKVCKIEVKPRHEYFSNPYLKFGALKSEVKTNVLTGTMFETDDAILYLYNTNSSSTAFIYYYIFEESGKLNGVVLEFSLLSIYSANIAAFIEERYIAVTSSGSIYYFLNKEQSMTVAIDLTYNSDGTVKIYYMPYTGQPILKSGMNLKEEIEPYMLRLKQRLPIAPDYLPQ